MMAPPTIARIAPVLVALTAAHGSEPVRNFDLDPAGRPPSGLTFRAARDAPPGRWTVQRDGSNGFLVHAGDGAAAGGFSLALLERRTPDAAESISARIRLAPGSRGAAGVLWRVQDADNYYLARLDLSRQDVGLYRVVHGNRVRIEGEDDLELDPGAWHTIKIVQEQEQIRVYLGGIRVLRARDRTFVRPGTAGVWCTGDAVAHFDDLKIGMDGKDAGAGRGR
jgi:hypothetical protein